MEILFGKLGEGTTVRAFIALAAAACLATIALGAQAERYAEARRPIPKPPAVTFSQTRVNAIDYATTGSVSATASEKLSCSDLVATRRTSADELCSRYGNCPCSGA
jgi:hypothetical protein